MIKQPSTDSGCGIACVANVIAESYEKTYKLMSKENCKNRLDDRVTISQLESFLLKNGIDFHNPETLNKEASSILYVRWPDNRKYKHWIVFHNGYFWDPSPSVIDPIFEYPTKPEHIIEINSDFVRNNLNEILA